MNLHSEHPFWSVQSGLIHAYPPIENDIRCDAVVIGGGITGAVVANCLVDSGISCTVIDRRDIAQGSTSASTALLQYEIDTPLHELSARFGKKPAERAYWLGVEAIHQLAALCKVNECSFAFRPSMLLARRKSHVEALQLELRARKAARLDVKWVGASELAGRYGWHRPGAIRSVIGAEVDPYRLTHALLMRNKRNDGLRVFDRTKAVSYEQARSGVLVRTDRGPTIAAKAVFFASGYETTEVFPRRLVRVKSTYATISEPLTDLDWWTERSLFWETGETYLYARTTGDCRIIVGGEDDSMVRPQQRDRQLAMKAAALRRKFTALTGKKFESAFSWAGPFASTKDGLAFIGPHPGFPRAFFALGFGGNGITFSVIASRILRDLFLGRPNRDAAIFSFAR